MQFDSIQTRLTLVAFIFIAGTAAIIGFAGIRYSSSFLAERYHAGFKVLADYMARNAELGVIIGDKKMLERQCRNMLTEKDISKVEILSGEGKVLAKVSDGMNLKEDCKEVTAEIFSSQSGDQSMFLYTGDKKKKLGMVVIDYRLKSLEILKHHLFMKLTFIGLFLSLIPVIWYYHIAKSISAPLRNLVTLSKEVSMGRMENRAELTNFHETRVLARTFNDMVDAIKKQREEIETAHVKMSRQRALAELGKFSMLVAHEIKNPLSIIKGSLDILKKDHISSEIRQQMLDYQTDEILRINRLVEDFLLFARPKKPDLIPTEMNAFIKNLTEKTGIIQSGSVTVKTLIASEKTKVLCDHNFMERALMNIIKNCLEACEEDGALFITTFQKNDHWFFRVEDNGPGIPDENPDKIFEPFFTTKAKGTGLGLAMAKDIVEMHNGRISAGNGEKCGAWFEISIEVHYG